MDEDVSDNDNEFYEGVAITAVAICTYYAKYIHKEPCMTSLYTGNVWLTEILHGNDTRCYSMFRMEKEVFLRLCHELKTMYKLEGSRNMSVEEMVAMFLFILGGGNSNRDARERFQHSGETVSRYFEKVLEAICQMATNMIQPEDREFKEIPKEILGDSRYYPYFKDAIGAIDGTHIPAIIKPEDQIRFIGRKGVPTQNVMAAVNFDMQFVFALAGWEGTAHDTRIFLYAVGTQALNFPKPPKGKYYSVDAGYSEKEGYLRSYKGETYHLPDFHRTGGPSGMHEVFNHAHSSLRSIIERTFGVWKKRWKILNGMPSFKYKKQVKIVIATMTLHNYIRRYSTRDQKFNKYSNQNVVLEEDVNGFEDEYENTDVQHVPGATDMTTIRNMIAASLMSSH